MPFFDLDAQPDKPNIRAFELTPNPKHAPVPVDPFELVLSNKPYALMTDAELFALRGTVMFFDIESFSNYFLAGFKSLVNGKFVQLENPVNCQKLLWILQNFCLIGYNSRNYDLPLLQLAAQGFGPEMLKSISNEIIFDEAMPWQIVRKYNSPNLAIDHIDLIEVAPLAGSLKLYAGRLHCQRMQDLPYPHDAILTPGQIEQVRQYNANDLDNTELLFHELKSPLALRYSMSAQYGVDVRSKSDAQIAEAVIAKEIERITNVKPTRPSIPPGKIFAYRAPKWAEYISPVLKEMLAVVKAAKFVVSENGSVEMPKELSTLKLQIGQCTYQMGIGGLHSTEKSVAHYADEKHLLLDRDVVSYYPAIILNEELYPRHLGKPFLEVYRSLVNRRIAAKKAGDDTTAASLKICVNGSFGKLGNKWSVLYSPDLLIQVTVTGQLALLMLIDMLEFVGISVLSANTDGILIKCPVELREIYNSTIAHWESCTRLQTEQIEYKTVFFRDVNNYIAVDKNNKPKVKGTYAEVGSAGNSVLSKNPENTICNDAVLAYLLHGDLLEDTINACQDIRKFVTIRNVKGGAEKSGVYLGKCIRWYYSTEMQGEINYVLSGNKVPNTDGARPLMELPTEIPADLDRNRYIAKAAEMLKELGV